jgi:hypothetical protein
MQVEVQTVPPPPRIHMNCPGPLQRALLLGTPPGGRGGSPANSEKRNQAPHCSINSRGHLSSCAPRLQAYGREGLGGGGL